MNHPFTEVILGILHQRFGDDAEDLLDKSLLLQYLNIKTRSANRGSKARGAFANHYALYVLVEDYINKGFLAGKKGQYKKYEGARFTDLLRRQRELPFGGKLQNHALNSRLNDEFAKYFPTSELRPILRDQADQRSWVNERLIVVPLGTGRSKRDVNIAEAIIYWILLGPTWRLECENRKKAGKQKMRLKINKEDDALYFRLDETVIVESEEVEPEVI